MEAREHQDYLLAGTIGCWRHCYYLFVVAVETAETPRVPWTGAYLEVRVTQGVLQELRAVVPGPELIMAMGVLFLLCMFQERYAAAVPIVIFKKKSKIDPLAHHTGSTPD